MIHKGLQGDIICEYRLRCHAATISTGVCGRGVELRQEETRLRTTSIANNETRQWETIGNKVL